MKKRLKLKSWVKWLIISLALLGIIELLNLYNKEEEKFVDKCINAGYTREYCLTHK
jgi:hypothetical protein